MEIGQQDGRTFFDIDAAAETLARPSVGTWKPGISVLGLKENGVGWALDDNNKALITADMKSAVDAAAADIASGKIAVHDYMSDSKCPD